MWFLLVWDNFNYLPTNHDFGRWNNIYFNLYFFVAWIAYMNEIFQLPSADVLSAFTTSVIFSLWFYVRYLVLFWWVTMQDICFLIFNKISFEMLLVFFIYYAWKFWCKTICLHAWAAWMLQNLVYWLLLNEVGNTKLGESDLPPIMSKTSPVSNCFVYI